MKHIGIVAEYNPFHNGHAYQIDKIKSLFPEKKLIVIMSGDFVQRGEPAVFNKYIRAACALRAGADLVLELPCLFATASAEHFASAAVLSLAATGVVDTLCFGAEHTDYTLFNQIADVLIEEPVAYRTLLKDTLKKGISYPKARALAVTGYLQNDDCEALLRQPNTILGIEYIKAIRKYHLNLKPCIIKRQGCDYHDHTLSGSLSSATALRSLLTQTISEPALSSLSDYMPASCFRLLCESPFAKPLSFADFYDFLQYALWQQDMGYRDYFDVTDALSNSLCRIGQYPDSIDGLISILSCKNYTDTRIRRALLNILLKHTKQDMVQAKNADRHPYLRILGFRSHASVLLREIKQTGTVTLINKTADARKILSADSYPYFQKDLQCSTLYKQVFFNKYGITMPSEYQQSVIIENL